MIYRLSFTCFVFCLFTLSLVAQQPTTTPDSTQPSPLVDYASPQTYEIGGIEVKGANYTDANGIIGISGLTVGSTIKIPSSQRRF